MVSVKKNILILALLGLSINLSSYSSDLGLNTESFEVLDNKNEGGISVEVKDGKIFMRLNGHVANEQATLVIKNSNGVTLFDREVEVMDNQIFKVFEKKTFETGSYSVSLIGETKTLKTQFAI